MAGMDPLRDRFSPQVVYLDTATYGLPADSVMAAMEEGLQRWQAGIATMDEYDAAVDTSRRLFAEIVSAEEEAVAVANQVSVFVGMVAASLPDGARVVAPEADFTSLLFPLLVHADRGVTVKTVDLDELADSIDADTDLVAFSLVQSADGSVADVDAIEEAARRHGAKMLVDATQAAGWLPLEAGRFDYLVAGAYKWLLCPRGTAFMTVSDAAIHDIRPLLANWYAGDDPWQSIYGPPLRLARSARRFDVSPGWLAWVGTAPALEVIASAGVDSIHRHDVTLADSLRDRLSLDGHGSAIVSIPLSDGSVLTERGIAAAVRAGSVRVGFHLYNDATDVEALVAAVESIGGN